MDNEESHECFHCGQEFSSATDFKKHLETHTKTAAPSPEGIVDLTDGGGEPHECYHCGKGFYSIPDLDNHMKIHDSAKNQTAINTPSVDTGGFVDLTEDGDDHECFHCGEEFGTADLLNSHLVTQHQAKPHKCGQCGESFALHYQLEAHELIHKDINSRVLSDVEMMYRSYNNNTKPSTSTQQKEDMDAASTSSTKHKGNIGTESLIHSAKQCHKCTYCTKTFTYPSDLRRHVVKHTGEKSHSCHLCPMKFCHTSKLYQHLRQSHRTGPHVCSHCGEGFDKMAALRVHKKIHLGDAPHTKPNLSLSTEDGALYKCAQCGDSFTERTDLDVHTQIHMSDTIEIRPRSGNGDFSFEPDGDVVTHKCPRCSIIFGGVAELNKHIIMCIPSSLDLNSDVSSLEISQPDGDVVTHKCPRCSAMFGAVAELNKHILICIPSSLDLNSHVKKEDTGVNNLNGNNLGVVDLTLDDDDEDEVDQYKCRRCDKSFRLEVELNAHIIMFHSTPDSHECFHCGEEFDIEDDLKLHILTAHEKTGLEHHKCPDCDKTFLLLSDFENHKKQKHPVCTICGHKFSGKKALDRHMKIMHHGANTCNHCKETFQTKTDLQTHKDTHHKKLSPTLSDDVPRYKCLQCDQSFTSKLELYKHCQTHLDPQPGPTAYKCYCGMQFSDPDNLERHKETHSDVVDLTFDDDETYNCSLCDDVFSREEELIVHMMTHPKQEPFECPECGKKFVFEKDYRFHLRTHVKAEASKKGHVCSDCDKAFSQLGELKKHLLTHTGDKPHQCPVCPKRFASLAVLQRHEATHGAEPHKCQHCGAGFWQTYYLQHHLEKECTKLQQGTAQDGKLMGKVLKANTSKTPSLLLVNGSVVPQEPQDIVPIKNETYTCCGWSFMSEADMKVHELSHKVTVYKCMQCMQVFRSTAELETHVKTHSQASSPSKVPYNDDSSTSSTLMVPSTSYIEDDRHICLQCGKEFRTVGFLNKHMQLHKAQLQQADKCHRCKECGQKFLSLAGLSKHALTHADKKPNQCPVCNDNFNNSAKLFEHMTTHDRGKTHSCTQCGKSFKRSTSLKSHMMTHTENYGHGLGGDPSENVDMPDINPSIPLPNVCEPNGARPTLNRMNLPHVKQDEEEEEEGDAGHMCTYCGRTFQQEKHLKSHFRTHMKSTSSTYYETKVKFNDVAGKELRIVTRVRKKRCKCYLCYKMFRRPSDLARHMMIHTGERPCKCSFCPAAFIQISHLKAHTMKNHKDITPPRSEEQLIKDKEVTADAVSKAKEAKKAKNISTITKYGRLPGYLCCGERFMTCQEIQHHWLVHNEEECYACPHCELKFTKGYTRTKHIMRMHSGTKPNCLDCGEEFAEFKDLIAHMKIHEAQLEDGDGASTNRVEVYNDVADGEPTSTNRVEVYTDVADADSVLVKAEVIPDEEDEPEEVSVLPRLDNIHYTAADLLSLKRETSQHSRPQVELDIDVDPIDPVVDPAELKKEATMDTDLEVYPTDPEVNPIALKKETSMDTTDDPSSPIDDAVLDSEPEENQISLNKEAMMDTDPPSPTDNAVTDIDPSSSNITIVDSLPPVPALVNQYRCLHCGERFSERGHLIPHVGNHTGRNYSSCNACKMGFLRKEELQVHLATHFMYPS